jgi:c-di-GMP-binding flagellar brake protein YcgR
MPKESEQTKAEAPPTFDLASINLQIGTRVQLITERTSRPQQYFATLIGYLAGAAVLVRTPAEGALTVPFQESEPLMVRVFSDVHVYSFRTFVERIQISPFPCLYLAYPSAVTGIAIRKAMRVKVDIPAQAIASGEPPQTSDVSLTDLSVAGGMIESDTKLGNVQDEIGISFTFIARPGDREIQIDARAIIRNLREPKPTASQKPGRYAHGVEFVNLDPTQQVTLQTLVYEAFVGVRQSAP